eukprot:Lithocolla_globosa_v1_NODE_1121_length_2853_cov_5.404217.p3 type:complete len:139 gc:universal NODE_1121_length_2853_cov_5.404217:2102-1686(-)
MSKKTLKKERTKTPTGPSSQFVRWEMLTILSVSSGRTLVATRNRSPFSRVCRCRKAQNPPSFFLPSRCPHPKNKTKTRKKWVPRKERKGQKRKKSVSFWTLGERTDHGFILKKVRCFASIVQHVAKKIHSHVDATAFG